MSKWTDIKLISGLLVSFGLAAVAWYLGKLFPIIGGPIFGILLGIILSHWIRPLKLDPGIRFASKKILQASIILLGFEMNLYNVFNTGSQSLLVMLFTLSAAFLIAWLMGRIMKIDGKVSTLIGVGTAICGGSAIAAVAPVIDADDKEIAYSISTIFLFNIAAVFLFPFIGHILSMADTGFGIWAGTAINDTSSVVAASYSYSDTAGQLATIVKLTRTLTIIPVTLFLAIYSFKKNKTEMKFSFVRIFPWFVLGFLAASIVSTISILPITVTGFLGQIGKFLIVVAMSAIGLNTNIKHLISNGIRPILLGLSCWFAVAVTSLIVQHIIGLW